MRDRINRLLDEYERGALSREAFAHAVADIASVSTEPSASSVFQGRTLNHVTLKVSDLDRSRVFYQEMFGLPLRKRTDDGYILGIGNSFLGIYQTDTVGLDHVCIGIDAFEFDPVMERLSRDHPTVKPRSRGDRAFLEDPDGIRFQLSAVDYPGA